ncbi:hypothetical protein [Streptomyces sp. NPDC051079]|uniref:hypothetical protein n=1 Tax=Streptomyces sp. NPDC051079 TaxID=3155043 RepID=UPI00344ED2B2
MTTKYCGYCHKLITGAAVDLTVHSDRGAHPPVWWHVLGDPECARPPLVPSLAKPHVGGRRLG